MRGCGEAGRRDPLGCGTGSLDVPPGILDTLLVQLQFAVILEKGLTSYGAYVPDLPGCIAAGEMRDEAVRLIQTVVEFHIEGLREDGIAGR